MSDIPLKATDPLPVNRAYVLFILVVVYTFNFIDRQIVGILAVPIKADLGLTDTQLGLMGGLAGRSFRAQPTLTIRQNSGHCFCCHRAVLYTCYRPAFRYTAGTVWR